MRYAIWSAVSTKSQARDDKISLAEQEDKCRSAGEVRGWTETSGPYVVPGATRSFYVNLSDAERDIPQLRQMLEDARNDLFDVVVIFSYDRLGDLVDMIAQSLRFYGKQIYSVSQPIEPQDPTTFDPYTGEAEAIMRDAARITQRFRINDLRRKYRAGMPVRIEKGLNPLSTPFGYKWVGKKEPPALVPEEAAFVLQLRDKFLQGSTVNSLVTWATQSGMPSPRGSAKWEATTIRYILGNPFYAGFVSLNKSKTVRDPRRKNQKKQVKQPRSKWTLAKGLHKPLWDENTYYELVDELERRREGNIKVAVRFPISGLMVCAVCGHKVHRRSHGTKGYNQIKVLTCKEGTRHVIMNPEETTLQVFQEFARHVSELRTTDPVRNKDKSVYQKAIDDLAAKRKRIQDGFAAGIFDQAEAAKNITDIDGQIDDLKLKMEEGEHLNRSRQVFLDRMPPMDKFPFWLTTQETAFVHRLLVSFVDKIVVHPGNRLEFIWRD